MKIFKHALLLLLLIILTAFSLQSYEQNEPSKKEFQKPPDTELTDVSEMPEDSLLAFQEAPYSKTKNTKKEDIDCRYANCRTKVSQLKAQFQPWVNANCKTKSFRIICCNYEGETVVLWVILKPTNPKCAYPNVFEHHPEG